MNSAQHVNGKLSTINVLRIESGGFSAGRLLPFRLPKHRSAFFGHSPAHFKSPQNASVTHIPLKSYVPNRSSNLVGLKLLKCLANRCLVRDRVPHIAMYVLWWCWAWIKDWSVPHEVARVIGVKIGIPPLLAGSTTPQTRVASPW